MLYEVVRSKPRRVGGFATKRGPRDGAGIAARHGEFVDRSTLTFRECLTQWLLAHVLEEMTPAPGGYTYAITIYVAPRIGRTRLQALRQAGPSALDRDLPDSSGRGGTPLSPRVVSATRIAPVRGMRATIQTWATVGPSTRGVGHGRSELPGWAARTPNPSAVQGEPGTRFAVANSIRSQALSKSSRLRRR